MSVDRPSSSTVLESLSKLFITINVIASLIFFPLHLRCGQCAMTVSYLKHFILQTTYLRMKHICKSKWWCSLALNKEKSSSMWLWGWVDGGGGARCEVFTSTLQSAGAAHLFCRSDALKFIRLRIRIFFFSVRKLGSWIELSACLVSFWLSALFCDS